MRKSVIAIVGVMLGILCGVILGGVANASEVSYPDEHYYQRYADNIVAAYEAACRIQRRPACNAAEVRQEAYRTAKEEIIPHYKNKGMYARWKEMIDDPIVVDLDARCRWVNSYTELQKLADAEIGYIIKHYPDVVKAAESIPESTLEKLAKLMQ